MAGMQESSKGDDVPIGGVAVSTACAGETPAPQIGGPPAERLLRLVHWTSAASRHLRRRLAEIAAEFDLSDAELLVVWLCHGGGHVQVELAGAIGISPAQMSGLVERLRARGLVEMQRQAMDRRRQVWRTSPAGALLLCDIAERFETLAAEIHGALDSDQQQALEMLCERIVEAVNPHWRRFGGNSGRTHEQDEQRGSKEAA
jgi:DNA-binding MarR family transcriptional regulator